MVTIWRISLAEKRVCPSNGRVVDGGLWVGLDEETLCHFLQLGKFIKDRAEKLWEHRVDEEEVVSDVTRFGKAKVIETLKLACVVALGTFCRHCRFGDGLTGARFSAMIFCPFSGINISNAHNTDVCRQGPPWLAGVKAPFTLGFSPPCLLPPLPFLVKSLRECELKFTAQGFS